MNVIRRLTAYLCLLAGLWIVSRARRSPDRRVELAVFGLAVASNAVGGVLFHAGAHTVTLDDPRFLAVPLSKLWEM